MREIVQYGEDDVTVRAIAGADWLEVIETPQTPNDLRSLGLGAGETAVLAWALANPGTTTILDEQRARRHAKNFGIPLRGTVGLILDAKRSGIVPEARSLIERVRRAGLYVSDRLLQESLRVVGE